MSHFVLRLIVVVAAIILMIYGKIIFTIVFDKYHSVSHSGRYHWAFHWWDEMFPWVPWVSWMAVTLIIVAILMLLTAKSSWGFWVCLLGAILCIFTTASFVIYLLATEYGEEKTTAQRHFEQDSSPSGMKLIKVHPRAGVDTTVCDAIEGKEYFTLTVTETNYVIKWGPFTAKRWVKISFSTIYHISPSVIVEPRGGGDSCLVRMEYATE